MCTAPGTDTRRRRPFYRFHDPEGNVEVPPGPVYPFDMYGRRSSLSAHTEVEIIPGLPVDSPFDAEMRTCVYEPPEPMRILLKHVERAPDKQVVGRWPPGLRWVQRGRQVSPPDDPIDSRCITVLQFMTGRSSDCWIADEDMAAVEYVYRNVAAVRFLQVYSGKYFAERRPLDETADTPLPASVMHALERTGNERLVAVDTPELDFFQEMGAIGWPFYVFIAPTGAVISKWYQGSPFGVPVLDNTLATVILMDVIFCGAMRFYGEQLRSMLPPDQYTLLEEDFSYEKPPSRMPTEEAAVTNATTTTTSSDRLRYPHKAIVIRRQRHGADAAGGQLEETFLVVADTANDRVVWRTWTATGLGSEASTDAIHFGSVDGLCQPRGLCYDPQHDLMYVADTGHHRIVRFRIPSPDVLRSAAVTVQVEQVTGTGKADTDVVGTRRALQQSVATPWDVSMLRMKAAEEDDGVDPFPDPLYISCNAQNQLWKLDFYRQPRDSAAAPVPRSCRAACGGGDQTQQDITQDDNRRYRIEPAQALQLVPGLAQPAGLVATYLPRAGTSPRPTLLFADSESSSVRQFDLEARECTTIAGGGSGDGDMDDLFDFGDADAVGNARAARFQHPLSIAYDAAHDAIYVADTLNNKIRRMDRTSGDVQTVQLVDEADVPLGLNEPSGLFYDAEGHDGRGALIVCDTNAHRVLLVEWLDGERGCRGRTYQVW
ncbi:hypothetical protein CDCA_CDCA01G0060 [Cyanidium caldarium]|uniref:NHL repeat containing protein n=1 Tax=Cyanidium caldarium TaxID=2771 RepID=A0AAV9INZ7_CYACA|nr:hypothetical protein CDCA_CDCA01G0060 [Cyanidium caldarium]